MKAKADFRLKQKKNENRANRSKRKTVKNNLPTFGFPQIDKEKKRERDTDVKLGCLSHSPRA